MRSTWVQGLTQESKEKSLMRSTWVQELTQESKEKGLMRSTWVQTPRTHSGEQRKKFNEKYLSPRTVEDATLHVIPSRTRNRRRVSRWVSVLHWVDCILSAGVLYRGPAAAVCYCLNNGYFNSIYFICNYLGLDCLMRFSACFEQDFSNLSILNGKLDANLSI